MESEFFDFNLNDSVFVKLTPRGVAILQDRHDKLQPCLPRVCRSSFKPPKKNKDGYSEFQAWVLFETFGDHIGMGQPEPFETTIRLRKDQLS